MRLFNKPEQPHLFIALIPERQSLRSSGFYIHIPLSVVPVFFLNIEAEGGARWSAVFTRRYIGIYRNIQIARMECSATDIAGVKEVYNGVDNLFQLGSMISLTRITIVPLTDF